MGLGRERPPRVWAQDARQATVRLRHRLPRPQAGLVLLLGLNFHVNKVTVLPKPLPRLLGAAACDLGWVGWVGCVGIAERQTEEGDKALAELLAEDQCHWAAHLNLQLSVCLCTSV